MARAPGLQEFEAQWRSLGAKAGHIHHIWRAWLGLTSWQPKQSGQFPAALQQALPEIQATLEGLLQYEHTESQQAESGKLLVRLGDGHLVESVLLPRQALCISTQVGCAVGCVFCMTGKSGLIRQLSSAEIVAQVVAARRVRPNLKKIVFMGMGEPSHNRRAVKEAVEFLGERLGLAHKQIVVSTVGDARIFDEFKTWRVKPAVALSLHTTNNEKRSRLLPNAAVISVEELLEKTLGYAEETGYPAQIEWTLMAGVNDSEAEVERLAQLIRGRYAMVNFIAVNAIPGSGFKRPERSHMEDLITILRKTGTVATIRDSAAQDIDGGCGQLRARHLAKICPENKGE